MSYPANKNGVSFGSFVITGHGRGFPARVAGASNAQRTFCDVWGFEHEMGDVYTSELRLITKEQFVEACAALGHTGDLSETYASKLKQWDKEQGTWAS